MRNAVTLCRFEEALFGTCVQNDHATATREGAGMSNIPFAWEQGTLADFPKRRYLRVARSEEAC